MSAAWQDSNEVVVLSGQEVSEFFVSAGQQNRLRVRASLVGNTIVNDEFNLRNLSVTEGTVQLRDPEHSEGPQELTCVLTN